MFKFINLYQNLIFQETLVYKFRSIKIHKVKENVKEARAVRHLDDACDRRVDGHAHTVFSYS